VDHKKPEHGNRGWPSAGFLARWLVGAVVVALLIFAAWLSETYNRLRSFEIQRATGLAAWPALAKVATITQESLSPAGQMIAQTASLTIVIQDFDPARTAVQHVVSEHQGFIAQLSVEGRAGDARVLTVALQVPAERLDAALADLKKLGHVEQESSANEDVSDQHVDLSARLRNARTTEQRLLDLLRQRTGKLEDVLEVEREVARIRLEVEQMERKAANLEHRIRYAAVQLQLREQHREQLAREPFSTRTELWNAFAGGYRNLIEGALGFVMFLLRYGPSLLFWTLILFWPTRFAWRRWRAARATGLGSSVGEL